MRSKINALVPGALVIVGSVAAIVHERNKLYCDNCETTWKISKVKIERNYHGEDRIVWRCPSCKQIHPLID